MTVKLSFDEYNILEDCDFDLVVNKKATSIRSARSQIINHLSSDQKGEFGVLIKSNSVLKKLNDLLSLKNVKAIEIIRPRLLLAEKIGFQPPNWLNNNVISKLNLLDINEISVREEFFLLDILRSLNLMVFDSKSFEGLISIITENFGMIEECLNIPIFHEQLVNFLIYELHQDVDATKAFIRVLEKSNDIEYDLKFISEQQALHLLKKFSKVHSLPSAFPPLEMAESITLLPLINYYSNSTIATEKYVDSLISIFNRPENSNNHSLVFELLIYPWPTLIEALDQIVKANPKLISKELVDYLLKFNSPISNELANKLDSKSKLNLLEPITKNEDVQRVIDWSYNYFELIKQSFEANDQEYETELTTSFSDWLLSQKARIERSKFDWRHVAQEIEDSLSTNDITVVFMVDALSQIHNKEIRERLSDIDNLDYSENIIFAPLPTLTKIGKKSVLTGYSPDKTSKSDYDILFERYKEYIGSEQNFIFLQDWKRAKSNQLSKDTKFVVVYINELDDRLHKTPSFSKHNSVAENIITSVRKTIDKWLKDSYALKKSISFYITADHGVTSLNSTVDNVFDEKHGERVVELSKSLINLPDNLYFIPGYGKTAGYVVPKSRASFVSPVALAHGGVTPEEVLIPFIHLKAVNNSNIKDHFSISSNVLECLLEADKKWVVKIPIVANETIKDIYIKAHLPFYGNEKIKEINKLESVLVPMKINSKHVQSGMTELTFTVQYSRNNIVLEKDMTLTLDIPLPLLKETDSSKNFGAMFDL
jgi:hypothetical protein